MADTIGVREAALFINEHVTYKPGYIIRANVPLDDLRTHLVLQLVFDGPDSREPENTKVVSFTQFYPAPFPSLEALTQLIRCFIHEWELHESDEWLRIDGEMVRDPHG